MASSGAVRKCSSTMWKPGEELGEPLPADGRHHRQPDRRVHRVAAADPVPEAEHVVGVDAEVVDQLLVRRHRDEVLGHRGVAERVGQPAPRRGRVGQRLQRGERLRRDDEKRCGRVESVELGHQVGGVDVGDEPRRDARVGVVAQRLVHHHRAEVRAADADVDDGLDALAGRARPLAAAQPVGEVAHLVQHLVHVGRRRPGRRRSARRRAACRSAVCSTARSSEVLMCTPENIASRRCSRSCGAGQIDQQLQRLAGDPVLAVVDVEVADRQRQLGAAARDLRRRARGGVCRRSRRDAAARACHAGVAAISGICCVSAVMFSTLVRPD